MIVEKAADNLKDKSNDEKKVVAGGIAISIVALLFVGWAILFLKKIENGERLQSLGGGAQDEFLGSAVRDAQKYLIRDFSDTEELRGARDQIGQQYQGGSPDQDLQKNDDDVFGGSGSIE